MTGYEAAAQTEREAFAQGEAQDAAAWRIGMQVELTASARARFLADGDAQSADDPLWVAFQTALIEEMRLRHEYLDTFGVPYDEEA